jgi:hypothetical protein
MKDFKKVGGFVEGDRRFDLYPDEGIDYRGNRLSKSCTLSTRH